MQAQAAIHNQPPNHKNADDNGVRKWLLKQMNNLFERFHC